MIVLGISAYFHDSSACLIVDGHIIAAALEERFTRVKHDASFPKKAIEYCLLQGGIHSSEIHYVVFFEKPFTKFERILESFLIESPKGFIPFQRAIKSWVKEKFWVEDVFEKAFDFKGEFLYCQHHLSHAANGIYQSHFKNAAYLIVDGVGEKSCTSFGVVKNGQIEPLFEQHYPHSIGLLYSAFTQYCGFKVNSGEYKLMGLAPYGQPKYKDIIYEHFVSFNGKAELKLKLKNFGFLSDLQMINKNFESVFGKKKRRAQDKMDQFYKDIAASIQKVVEEILIKLVNYVLDFTDQQNLVFGGGVALNCVANSKVVQHSKVKELFIHSASGDGGGAMGAALWASNLKSSPIYGMESLEFLGPEFNSEEIKNALNQYHGIIYAYMDGNDLDKVVGHSLNENKVVGWFQGRMEFGPRALGNRSILASPLHPKMKSILNVKIKKREGFRPFAPVVLHEKFDQYFKDDGVDYSKMLYVAEGQQSELIPACIHEDNTSRVQRLKKSFNPRLYRLLTKFEKISGVPILINTSFNERGEPIVNSPEDALACFFNTDMDLLVMDNFLIKKEDNLQVIYKKKVYELD